MNVIRDSCRLASQDGGMYCRIPTILTKLPSPYFYMTLLMSTDLSYVLFHGFGIVHVRGESDDTVWRYL